MSVLGAKAFLLRSGNAMRVERGAIPIPCSAACSEGEEDFDAGLPCGRAATEARALGRLTVYLCPEHTKEADYASPREAPGSARPAGN